MSRPIQSLVPVALALYGLLAAPLSAWAQETSLRQAIDAAIGAAWQRELLKAEGNSVDGSALFFAQYSRSPEDASEAITQTFLGIQLQCARCHDHPYEQWKQRDFYGMAAFLSRLEVVTAGKKGNDTMY